MYLEISGRQSGKTERLIDFAIDKARKGDTVLISTFNIRNVSTIKNHIRSKVANEKIIIDCGNRIYKEVGLISLIDITDKCIDTAVCFRKYKWKCFDEFDFNSFIRPEYIDKNCYFVTSPKYLRKVEERKQTNNSDLLYQLVLKKKYRYRCFIKEQVLKLPNLTINERTGIWMLDKNNNPIEPKEYTIV
jgi:hypothetical protein